LISISNSSDLRYHYTSAHGLRGIIQDRELWGTEILYLNDSTEWRYIFELLTAEIRDAAPRGSPFDSVGIAKLVSELLDKTINCYVTCFCLEGDLLSQWRGYSGGIGGYAIGFNWTMLKSLHESSDQNDRWEFAPVTYDVERQRSRIREISTTCFKNAFQAAGPDGDLDLAAHVAIGTTLAILSMEAATFKHHGFAEEKEWRVVRTLARDHTPHASFRVSNTQLVPYIGFPVAAPGATTIPAIERIIIGPNPDSASAVRALKMFLSSEGFEDGMVEIVPSDVPFRD
jgi:Protein of unknown function (DUF2971)